MFYSDLCPLWVPVTDQIFCIRQRITPVRNSGDFLYGTPSLDRCNFSWFFRPVCRMLSGALQWTTAPGLGILKVPNSNFCLDRVFWQSSSYSPPWEPQILLTVIWVRSSLNTRKYLNTLWPSPPILYPRYYFRLILYFLWNWYNFVQRTYNLKHAFTYSLKTLSVLWFL
jgi:hypothetical protein